MADVEELARRFRSHAGDHARRSPLYSTLAASIADDPVIIDLLRAAPEQQQQPVLLFAAVHAIVLAEPDSELGGWYPSVTGTPRDGDPFPAFSDLCRERADDIRRIVATRVTQTNEVGRCALFLPVLGRVAAEMGSLSLVDVGASAGLNMHLDRFSYGFDPGGCVGGPSPVRIRTETRGPVPVPDDMPHIVGRIGLDRAPIDATDADAARWLMACLWPDQSDRLERLRGALEIAGRHPTTIVEGDAVESVAGVLRSVDERGHPVVLNSWVLNYLSDEDRLAYVGQLDLVGAERDLTWVFAESPALCPGLPFDAEIAHEQTTALIAVRWRDGTRTVRFCGRAHPHGYWLQWTGAGNPRP